MALSLPLPVVRAAKKGRQTDTVCDSASGAPRVRRRPASVRARNGTIDPLILWQQQQQAAWAGEDSQTT